MSPICHDTLDTEALACLIRNKFDRVHEGREKKRKEQSAEGAVRWAGWTSAETRAPLAHMLKVDHQLVRMRRGRTLMSRPPSVAMQGGTAGSRATPGTAGCTRSTAMCPEPSAAAPLAAPLVPPPTTLPSTAASGIPDSAHAPAGPSEAPAAARSPGLHGVASRGWKARATVSRQSRRRLMLAPCLLQRLPSCPSCLGRPSPPAALSWRRQPLTNKDIGIKHQALLQRGAWARCERHAARGRDDVVRHGQHGVEVGQRRLHARRLHEAVAQAPAKHELQPGGA